MSRWVMRCLYGGLVLLCLLCVGASVLAGGPVVRVMGSSAVASSVDALAASFMKKHPDVSVVVSGGGTGKAIESLLNGSIEVVMTTLPLTARENERASQKGVELSEKLVGWSGTAVFVHPGNQVSELSLEQLKKILNGEYTSWKQAGGADGPITVYVGPASDDDTTAFLKDYVLKRGAFRNDAIQRKYVRNRVKAVSEDPRGIGYAPLAQTNRYKSSYSVKMAGIKKRPDAKAVYPSGPTIEDRTYSLISPVYLYIKGKSVPKYVLDFRDFCRIWGLSGKAAPSSK